MDGRSHPALILLHFHSHAELDLLLLSQLAEEGLDLPVPKILVGGNRDIERMEAILQRGAADFLALCRPLIREPGLPKRWQEGQGKAGCDCISCNSCVYDMFTHVNRGEPWVTTCLARDDPSQVKKAQEWLTSWVAHNTLPSFHNEP